MPNSDSSSHPSTAPSPRRGLATKRVALDTHSRQACCRRSPTAAGKPAAVAMYVGVHAVALTPGCSPRPTVGDAKMPWDRCHSANWAAWIAADVPSLPLSPPPAARAVAAARRRPRNAAAQPMRTSNARREACAAGPDTR